MARIGEGSGAHRVLVGKHERKRPLRRPRRRWEDNIKMDLQEMGGGYGGWIELAQNRERWRVLCEYDEEPSDYKNAGNVLTSCRAS